MHIKYIYTNTYVSVYAYVLANEQACEVALIHTQLYMLSHTYTQAHTKTQTHPHTYTCSHG